MRLLQEPALSGAEGWETMLLPSCSHEESCGPLAYVS
jgi:hypothetical protein